MDKLIRGTQIAYIPNHAEGNIKHKDVEFGFVTSGPAADGSYFCRYWRRGHPGQLRTVANSELTPADNLVAHTSTTQAIVDLALKTYC